VSMPHAVVATPPRAATPPRRVQGDEAAPLEEAAAAAALEVLAPGRATAARTAAGLAAAERLAASDEEVRYGALLELIGLGRAARPHGRRVAQLLREERQSLGVRMLACEALVALGEDAASEASLALEAQLGSEEPTLRRVAVLSLGHLQGAHHAVAAVVPLLRDANLQVRDAALVALCLMLGSGAAPTGEMAKATASRLREPLLRESAAVVLGLLGPEGGCWAGELLPYLSDSDLRVREAVVEALVNLREHLDQSILQELRGRSVRDAKLGAEAAKVALDRLTQKVVVVD